MSVSKDIDFNEWFLPGLPWWLIAPGFGAAIALALLPIGSTIAIIGGVVMTLLTAALLALWSPRIEVRDDVLYAGPAHIEVAWLGTARELHGEDLRGALGPELDARTWVCVRPWVKSAVIIENTDPQDPAPAWIIASRRPAQLVQAVASSQTESD